MADEYHLPDEVITAALCEAKRHAAKAGQNGAGFVEHLRDYTDKSVNAVNAWLDGTSEPKGGNLRQCIGALGPEFGTALLAEFGLKVVLADDETEQQHQARREWYEAGAEHMGGNVTRLKGRAG